MAEVIVRSDVNLQHEISTDKHRWMADEPREVGGDDTGPDPYELLLGALGACTSMTLLLYARRKQLPLDGVEVQLVHSKVYADDCQNCDDAAAKIDRVERRITLHGTLNDEQQQRLHEIARKCPVHRTLERGVQVIDMEPAAA